jgi:formate/nitrite transporter FocA (FNT family)
MAHFVTSNLIPVTLGNIVGGELGCWTARQANADHALSVGQIP